MMAYMSPREAADHVDTILASAPASEGLTPYQKAALRVLQSNVRAADSAADDDFYEQLAAVQHDIWSHWMKYLIGSKTFAIETEPAGRGMRTADVEHWRRQAYTPYAELTEQEKASDREQVDRFWHLVHPTPRGDLVALREWLDDEMEKEAELLLRVHNPLREHRLSTLREVRDRLPGGTS